MILPKVDLLLKLDKRCWGTLIINYLEPFKEKCVLTVQGNVSLLEGSLEKRARYRAFGLN